MKRVLVVEDEPAVADVIEFALRKAGFEVEVTASRRSAESRLVPGRFAAVILDLGLPDGDGTDLCRWLRARPDETLHSIPIVMVTCRDEEVDRVLGLEGGADDYVVKPFSPRELAARVASVVRRANNQFGREQELVLGPLALSRVSFRAHTSGRPVPLTKTEFELLWVLCESPARVFTREALEASWDPIETVYGVGYRARTERAPG